MKTIDTLFDSEVVKERRNRTAESKLLSGLRSSLKESVYKYQIIASRVFFNKIKSFPDGVTKEQWIEAAKRVWADAGLENHSVRNQATGKIEQIKLFDASKANQ